MSALRARTPLVVAVPSTPLRAATLATAVAGMLTLASAGVVDVATAAISALLVTLTTWMSTRYVSESATANRKRISVSVLGIASIAAVLASSGGVTGSTGRTLGLLLCAAAITHSLVLDSVRDQRVNLGISVSMLVLAAGLAPGLRIAGPVALTWMCAVTALVLASTDAQAAGTTYLARPVSDASPASSPRAGNAPVTTAAVAVVVTLCAGFALALVLPHPPGVSAHSSFGSKAGADPATNPGTARDAQAYLGGGPLDLNARGSLSTAQVAVVTGPGSGLWRAVTLEEYDGHSWSNPTGDRGLLAGTRTTTTVARDGRSPGQSGTGTLRNAVGWLAPTVPVVLSPGIPTHVSLREAGTVVRDVDGRLLVTATGTTPSYVVESDAVPTIGDVAYPADTTGDAKAHTASKDDSGVATTWTALPATLPARVEALARQVTRGTDDRAQQIALVESFLRGHATYDLQSPVTPADQDTVDDFLFHTRSGFCEQFASAEVVMLRSLGIPARLVSGFAAGAPEADGTTVLIGADAHAWVEAWIPGTGWVSSDPTAGATPVAKHGGRNLAAQLQRLVDAATGSPVRKVGLALLLVLVALLAIGLPGRLTRRRSRRRARSSSVAADRRTVAPLFAAFHRLEQALAATGRARGDAESVRALAGRLHATDDVVGALLAVERASYASEPPSADEARAAAQSLDDAAARLLANPTSP